MNEKEMQAKLVEQWSRGCVSPVSSNGSIYEIVDGKFHYAPAASLAPHLELLTRLSGIPSNAQAQGLTWQWESVGDTVFSQRLPKQIDNYELRQAQVNMARMVQRSHEMQQHAVIEAGTGTGKSYGYLYPTQELGLKIIVSTSNKALQAQLINKDIPAVLKSYPGKKFAVAQGKRNYACREKVSNVELTGDLASWYLTTETGNTESIDFTITSKQIADITADDKCVGRHCSHYNNCFYYRAKEQRQNADIVVCNHALLAIHLANPEAKLLPEVDMIIVDEAHKLGDYIRSTFASEVKLSSIQHYIDMVKRANIAHIELMQQAEVLIAQMQVAIEKNNPVTLTEKLDTALLLSSEFKEAAEIIFPEGGLPTGAETKKEWRQAKDMRLFAAKLAAIGCPTQPGYVRWIESRQDGIFVINAPWGVAQIMGGILYPKKPPVMSRTICRHCGEELSETVAVLGGRGYCGKCIGGVDLEGDAEVMSFDEYLAQPTQVDKIGTPFVFCSATLATPDLSVFMRNMGITSALQMIAPSPFDYKKNTLLYIPNGDTPAPAKETLKAWEAWLPKAMQQVVTAASGGAFLLFSSWKNLNMVLDQIGTPLATLGYTVLVQGKQTKAQIIAEFKAKSNCILFGLESYGEGVDIQGYNLRLVCMDKMPFSPPHPITEAIKAAGAGDWFTVDLPETITRLKQRAGRLVRTTKDKGVVVIFDSRILTSPYGRNKVLPSLPPSTLVHADYMVSDFFLKMRQERDRKLTPMEVFEAERSFTLPVEELDGVPF
jgi:ATP-dependent DNA helicase DinG